MERVVAPILIRPHNLGPNADRHRWTVGCGKRDPDPRGHGTIGRFRCRASTRGKADGEEKAEQHRMAPPSTPMHGRAFQLHTRAAR